MRGPGRGPASVGYLRVDLQEGEDSTAADANFPGNSWSERAGMRGLRESKGRFGSFFRFACKTFGVTAQGSSNHDAGDGVDWEGHAG